jgi:hypothetical protein
MMALKKPAFSWFDDDGRALKVIVRHYLDSFYEKKSRNYDLRAPLFKPGLGIGPAGLVSLRHIFLLLTFHT